VWLAALGPHGLRDVAAMGAAKAAELEAALAAIGVPRVHAAAYLNEFAIRVPNAAAVHHELLSRGVLAGLVVAEAVPDEPSLGDALLVCATELTTSDEITTFARELAGVSATLAADAPVPAQAPVGAGT
jgi:glycine dehydrogenase subunit 1